MVAFEYLWYQKHKESFFSGLYFYAILSIPIQSCICKGQNALKHGWQQTTKGIFTDIKRWILQFPYIKKNLFLPGFYTPKSFKTVTFTLKWKILGLLMFGRLLIGPSKPSADTALLSHQTQYGSNLRVLVTVRLPYFKRRPCRQQYCNVMVRIIY